MKDKSITSLKEDDLLEDLERLSQFLISHKQSKAIVVSRKQKNLISDLVWRRKTHALVDRAGFICNLSSDGKTYRGFEIKALEEARRHKKTDLLQLPI